MTSDSHPVLLFDGHCNLCNGYVQFVIKWDHEARFRFAPLQSNYARLKLGDRRDLTDEISTVVLVEGDQVYTHSDVPLRMAGHLGGAWPLFKVFWLLPKGFRDWIYRWVAHNRYRWFGRKEQCMIPTPELQARFLS